MRRRRALRPAPGTSPMPWAWARQSTISTASAWPTSAGHEHELLRYGTAALERVPGLRIIGTAAEKAGVLSFVLDGVRTEEVGDLLNREGIAVRCGTSLRATHPPALRPRKHGARVAGALQHLRRHRRSGGRAPAPASGAAPPELMTGRPAPLR